MAAQESQHTVAWFDLHGQQHQKAGERTGPQRIELHTPLEILAGEAKHQQRTTHRQAVHKAAALQQCVYLRLQVPIPHTQRKNDHSIIAITRAVELDLPKHATNAQHRNQHQRRQRVPPKAEERYHRANIQQQHCCNIPVTVADTGVSGQRQQQILAAHRAVQQHIHQCKQQHAHIKMHKQPQEMVREHPTHIRRTLLLNGTKDTITGIKQERHHDQLA